MQHPQYDHLPEFSDSRREPYGPDVFPDGFRAMTAAEGDELDAMAHVLLFDRATRRITRWAVESYSNQWGWRVVLRDGPEVVDSVRLDVDDPDYWSDADVQSGRARRGPEGEQGRVVAVVPISPTDLAPLLAQSFYPLVAQDVLREVQESRDGRVNPWVCSDGRYFRSDLDARQHQRLLDTKKARALGMDRRGVRVPVVAALALGVPARRASRANPADVLRCG